MSKAISAEPTYARAYAALLDHLLSFATTSLYGDLSTEYPRTMGGLTGFVICGFGADEKPEVGDLVLLKSAPASKWRLSWLREVRQEAAGDQSYLCASVVDGALCWWSNVGIAYLHRLEITKHPEWKWSDDQYDFNDRWIKACNRHDPYMYRPLRAVFNEDGTATLGTRTRFDFDGYSATVVVPSWKKITIKALAGIYLALVAEHKAQPKAKDGDS